MTFEERVQEIIDLPQTRENKPRRRALGDALLADEPERFTDLPSRTTDEIRAMSEAARAAGDMIEVTRLEVFQRGRFSGSISGVVEMTLRGPRTG